MLKVKLLTHTPNPEHVIATAAKVCYSSCDIDSIMKHSQEDTARFVKMLSQLGHQSPLEHASFTFAIEGISRAALAQITRHRIGSFSVKSQRYVSEGGFDFITPDSIKDDKECYDAYLGFMEQADKLYKTLTDKLMLPAAEQFVKDGEAKEDALKKAQKAAIEDARFVLPNACTTQMVLTMNARSLINFFRLRCCNRAQWEIRSVADEMLSLVKDVSPNIFEKAGAPCVSGRCSEGKMSCGHPRV